MAGAPPRGGPATARKLENVLPSASVQGDIPIENASPVVPHAAPYAIAEKSPKLSVSPRSLLITVLQKDSRTRGVTTICEIPLADVLEIYFDRDRNDRRGARIAKPLTFANKKRHKMTTLFCRATARVR